MATHLEPDSRAVVRFYNQRGTSDQWMKEGRQAAVGRIAALPVAKG